MAALRRASLALAFLACLAASATAELPVFTNPGGPSFLSGATYQTDLDTYSLISVGWTLNSTYLFTLPGPDGFTQEAGTYTSWQCGTDPGTYTAIVEVVYTYPDGTSEEKTYCEYGLVNFLYASNDWAISETECPTVAENSNSFIDSVDGAVNECGEPESGITGSTPTDTNTTDDGPLTSTTTGTTDSPPGPPAAI